MFSFFKKTESPYLISYVVMLSLLTSMVFQNCSQPLSKTGKRLDSVVQFQSVIQISSMTGLNNTSLVTNGAPFPVLISVVNNVGNYSVTWDINGVEWVEGRNQNATSISLSQANGLTQVISATVVDSETQYQDIKSITVSFSAPPPSGADLLLVQLDTVPTEQPQVQLLDPNASPDPSIYYEGFPIDFNAIVSCNCSTENKWVYEIYNDDPNFDVNVRTDASGLTSKHGLGAYEEISGLNAYSIEHVEPGIYSVRLEVSTLDLQNNRTEVLDFGFIRVNRKPVPLAPFNRSDNNEPILVDSTSSTIEHVSFRFKHDHGVGVAQYWVRMKPDASHPNPIKHDLGLRHANSTEGALHTHAFIPSAVFSSNQSSSVIQELQFLVQDQAGHGIEQIYDFLIELSPKGAPLLNVDRGASHTFHFSAIKGQTQEQEITLVNDGDTDLKNIRLSSPDFSELHNNFDIKRNEQSVQSTALFRMAGDGSFPGTSATDACDPSLTLAPGASCRIRVVFQAEIMDNIDDDYSIESTLSLDYDRMDDSTMGPLHINLHGASARAGAVYRWVEVSPHLNQCPQDDCDGGPTPYRGRKSFVCVTQFEEQQGNLSNLGAQSSDHVLNDDNQAFDLNVTSQCDTESTAAFNLLTAECDPQPAACVDLAWVEDLNNLQCTTQIDQNGVHYCSGSTPYKCINRLAQGAVVTGCLLNGLTDTDGNDIPDPTTGSCNSCSYYKWVVTNDPIDPNNPPLSTDFFAEFVQNPNGGGQFVCKYPANNQCTHVTFDGSGHEVETPASDPSLCSSIPQTTINVTTSNSNCKSTPTPAQLEAIITAGDYDGQGNQYTDKIVLGLTVQEELGINVHLKLDALSDPSDTNSPLVLEKYNELSYEIFVLSDPSPAQGSSCQSNNLLTITNPNVSNPWVAHFDPNDQSSQQAYNNLIDALKSPTGINIPLDAGTASNNEFISICLKITDQFGEENKIERIFSNIRIQAPAAPGGGATPPPAPGTNTPPLPPPPIYAGISGAIVQEPISLDGGIPLLISSYDDSVNLGDYHIQFTVRKSADDSILLTNTGAFFPVNMFTLWELAAPTANLSDVGNGRTIPLTNADIAEGDQLYLELLITNVGSNPNNELPQTVRTGNFFVQNSQSIVIPQGFNTTTNQLTNPIAGALNPGDVSVTLQYDQSEFSDVGGQDSNNNYMGFLYDVEIKAKDDSDTFIVVGSVTDLTKDALLASQDLTLDFSGRTASSLVADETIQVNLKVRDTRALDVNTVQTEKDFVSVVNSDLTLAQASISSKLIQNIVYVGGDVLLKKEDADETYFYDGTFNRKRAAIESMTGMFINYIDFELPDQIHFRPTLPETPPAYSYTVSSFKTGQNYPLQGVSEIQAGDILEVSVTATSGGPYTDSTIVLPGAFQPISNQASIENGFDIQLPAELLNGVTPSLEILDPTDPNNVLANVPLTFDPTTGIAHVDLSSISGLSEGNQIITQLTLTSHNMANGNSVTQVLRQTISLHSDEGTVSANTQVLGANADTGVLRFITHKDNFNNQRIEVKMTDDDFDAVTAGLQYQIELVFYDLDDVALAPINLCHVSDTGCSITDDTTGWYSAQLLKGRTEDDSADLVDLLSFDLTNAPQGAITTIGAHVDVLFNVVATNDIPETPGDDAGRRNTHRLDNKTLLDPNGGANATVHIPQVVASSVNLNYISFFTNYMLNGKELSSLLIYDNQNTNNDDQVLFVGASYDMSGSFDPSTLVGYFGQDNEWKDHSTDGKMSGLFVLSSTEDPATTYDSEFKTPKPNEFEGGLDFWVRNTNNTNQSLDQYRPDITLEAQMKVAAAGSNELDASTWGCGGILYAAQTYASNALTGLIYERDSDNKVKPKCLLISKNFQGFINLNNLNGDLLINDILLINFDDIKNAADPIRYIPVQAALRRSNAYNHVTGELKLLAASDPDNLTNDVILAENLNVNIMPLDIDLNLNSEQARAAAGCGNAQNGGFYIPQGGSLQDILRGNSSGSDKVVVGDVSYLLCASGVAKNVQVDENNPGRFTWDCAIRDVAMTECMNQVAALNGSTSLEDAQSHCGDITASLSCNAYINQLACGRVSIQAGSHGAVKNMPSVDTFDASDVANTTERLYCGPGMRLEGVSQLAVSSSSDFCDTSVKPDLSATDGNCPALTNTHAGFSYPTSHTCNLSGDFYTAEDQEVIDGLVQVGDLKKEGCTRGAISVGLHSWNCVYQGATDGSGGTCTANYIGSSDPLTDCISRFSARMDLEGGVNSLKVDVAVSEDPNIWECFVDIYGHDLLTQVKPHAVEVPDPNDPAQTIQELRSFTFDENAGTSLSTQLEQYLQTEDPNKSMMDYALGFVDNILEHLDENSEVHGTGQCRLIDRDCGTFDIACHVGTTLGIGYSGWDSNYECDPNHKGLRPVFVENETKPKTPNEICRMELGDVAEVVPERIWTYDVKTGCDHDYFRSVNDLGTTYLHGGYLQSRVRQKNVPYSKDVSDCDDGGCTSSREETQHLMFESAMNCNAVDGVTPFLLIPVPVLDSNGFLIEREVDENGNYADGYAIDYSDVRISVNGQDYEVDWHLYSNLPAHVRNRTQWKFGTEATALQGFSAASPTHVSGAYRSNQIEPQGYYTGSFSTWVYGPSNVYRSYPIIGSINTMSIFYGFGYNTPQPFKINNVAYGHVFTTTSEDDCWQNCTTRHPQYNIVNASETSLPEKGAAKNRFLLKNSCRLLY